MNTARAWLRLLSCVRSNLYRIAGKPGDATTASGADGSDPFDKKCMTRHRGARGRSEAHAYGARGFMASDRKKMVEHLHPTTWRDRLLRYRFGAPANIDFRSLGDTFLPMSMTAACGASQARGSTFRGLRAPSSKQSLRRLCGRVSQPLARDTHSHRHRLR